MNCFEHPQTPAVGTCKHCCKGICTECAADTGVGVACKNRCEETVREMHTVASMHLRAGKHAGTSYNRNALFMIITGIVFFAWGALMTGMEFSLALGTIFILYGIFIYSQGKKIVKTR